MRTSYGLFCGQDLGNGTGYNMGYWFAAYAPAGTPTDVVNKLTQLLGDAVESKSAEGFYKQSGTTKWRSTSAELAKFQAEETK